MNKLFFALFALFAVAQGQANCETCINLVTFAENLVLANATQIVQTLETLCAVVPQFNATCVEIVEADWQQVLLWIEQNESPKQICQQLEICTQAKKPSFKPIMKPKLVGNTINCLVCETAVGEITQLVSQGLNVTDINNQIMNDCNQWGVGSICKAQILPEVDQIIKLIESGSETQQICDLLTLCP
eukprot:TRINITY_DN740_c0_g1_i1.p1 TRINITY_DN740_c0_g1~~TRINITY_DN740_c0_g1_i1.p1  ORF type:complete len:210 (-),score=65.46 TRINITY_DN740_c0_g1_i1:113-673(-)